MAYLAANLATLRTEVDLKYPTRDHTSDGWIGDSRHQAGVSDHNPDSRGCVHAIDVDVDGIDPLLLVRRAIAHPTAEYVIYNRTIWMRSNGFVSRAYNGDNPHDKHVHISGKYGSANENNVLSWGIYILGGPAPAPAPPPPSGSHEPGTRELFWNPPGQEFTGADVAYAQRWIGPRYAGAPDGVFGGKTRGGVMWYQRQQGLTADGIVGPRTWARMQVTWRG